MTILVTGATGLLGNHLVRLLIRQGKAVRVLTRSAQPTRALAGLNLEIAVGDICDRSSVQQAMRNVAGVIHSAGHVHIGWSQAEQHRAINVEGTRHVAESAHEQQVRMVYVSSVNALGLSKRDGVADEDTFLSGIVECPYVTTKRAAEMVVLDLVKRGLQAMIVNPGFMLGPMDWKPSSGRMMLEVTSRFAPLAPSGSFSVCDVRDVAEAVITALVRGEPGRHYILCGHNLRYYELWQKMAKEAGVRGPWFPAGPMQRFCIGMFGDLLYKLTGKESDFNSAGIRMSSQHHNFRSARAIKELGYKIRPLEETIHDAWQWFVENGYVKRR